MGSIVQRHTVPEHTGPVRLSDYVHNVFDVLPSRKSARKAIEKRMVLVDGVPRGTGYFVKPGDLIEIISNEISPSRIYERTLRVLYEDDSIAVVYKPPGLRTNGNQFKTLEHALPYNLYLSGAIDALPAPVPVHRLDSPTSGLVIAAKRLSSAVSLGRQFQGREVLKRYRAVVIGAVEGNGVIHGDIDGRDAVTMYRAVRQVRSLRNSYLTLLDLWPRTGRQHQLRKHLSGEGYPILGDPLYGTEGLVLKSKGVFLSAVEISFRHPEKKWILNVRVEDPEKFATYMNREERRWNRNSGIVKNGPEE
ncbi:MAG TPA: RluA family pseudouridine synthase [Spirochaetota bacterium]|nr:RluA family pseudouridine synthase [Spirochaetota bacterium]HPQ52764.1 RluA family pseudouridine synthase [Spirochaetota bacterium]